MPLDKAKISERRCLETNTFLFFY